MTGRKQKEGLLSKLGDVVVGFERALNSEDARARTAWVRCRTSFERCCQVELGWRFQQALNKGTDGKYELRLDRAAEGYEGLADFVILDEDGPVAVVEMKGAFPCQPYFGRCADDSSKPEQMNAAFNAWGGGPKKGMAKDVSRLRRVAGRWPAAVVVLAIGASDSGDPCPFDGKCEPAEGCLKIGNFAGALEKIMESQGLKRVDPNPRTSRSSDDVVRVDLFSVQIGPQNA